MCRVWPALLCSLTLQFGSRVTRVLGLGLFLCESMMFGPGKLGRGQIMRWNINIK